MTRGSSHHARCTVGLATVVISLLLAAIPPAASTGVMSFSTGRFAVEINAPSAGYDFTGEDSIGRLTGVIEGFNPVISIPGSGEAAMFNPTEFTFTRSVTWEKRPDRTSPLWLIALCTGEVLDSVEITIFLGDPVVETTRVRLDRVVVRGWDPVEKHDAAGNPVAMEEIVLSYEDITLTDVSTGISTIVRADGTCELRMSGGP